MRELGFRRVLFLVHRGQLARQTKKSYEKIFDKSVSMGLVGAGNRKFEVSVLFIILNHRNCGSFLIFITTPSLTNVSE